MTHPFNLRKQGFRLRKSLISGLSCATLIIFGLTGAYASDISDYKPPVRHKQHRIIDDVPHTNSNYVEQITPHPILAPRIPLSILPGGIIRQPYYHYYRGVYRLPPLPFVRQRYIVPNILPITLPFSFTPQRPYTDETPLK